jgi:hypothetical protein
MRYVLIAVAAVLAGAPALAADIYRDIDPSGVVIYTDTPTSPDAKPLDIRSNPTDPERVAMEASALAAAEQARREQSDAQPAAAGEEQPDPAEQCREARERAETYAAAPRLYEPLPDGGRRYLTDEELARQRDAAEQAVVRYCDSR